MKNVVVFTCLLQVAVVLNAQQQAGMWTWVRGDSITYAPEYSAGLGVASPLNKPGGRKYPANWIDTAGNFWIYGGASLVVTYTDLWKFDVATEMWTEVFTHHTSNIAAPIGVFSPDNAPGPLGYDPTAWVDSKNHFWIYGGTRGPSIVSGVFWQYDPAINQWAWMGGTPGLFMDAVFGTKGVPSANNTPGSLHHAKAAWVDSLDNLWFFGGYTTTVYYNAAFNCMWKYDVTANMWVWMSGSNVPNDTGSYGLIGVADTGYFPQANTTTFHWQDNDGNFWLISPGGPQVWKFNPYTLEWTYVRRGDSPLNVSSGYYVEDSLNEYATRAANGFAKISDKLIVSYGGYNGGFFSDLWTYQPDKNVWMQISDGPYYGSFGIQGIPNPQNHPGRRSGLAGFADRNHNLWIFGGHGDYNDLWKYTFDTSKISISLMDPLICNTTKTSSTCHDSCNGTASVAAINGTAPYTYRWTPGNYTAASLTGLCAGTYTISVTDNVGRTFIDEIVVGEPIAIDVVITASDSALCPGDSIALTVGPTSAYLWSNGATTQQTTAFSAGDYTITVTDINACSRAAPPKTIYSNAMPVPVITAGSSTTFCFGDSVVLSCSPAMSYQWFNGGNAQTRKVFVSGDYTVTVTNAAGCTNVSLPLHVTVNPPANTPVITASGGATFCQGDSVTLTSSAAISYQWPNGVTTQSIKVFSSGNYVVTVTNATGCKAVSSPQIITVNPLPPVPSISANTTTNFCNGDSVTFTANTAQSYLWSTGQTTQSIIVSAQGKYTVTVTNSNVCSNTSQPQTVVVHPKPAIPVITPNGPTTFCQGNTVTLTTDTANTYHWSNAANTKSIDVTASGNYVVTITNAFGCTNISNVLSVVVNPTPAIPVISANGTSTFCTGDSVILTSSSEQFYLWSNGTPAQSVVVTSPGSYAVTVTNAAGCSNVSLPQTVVVHPNPAAPAITANGATTFCQGDTVTLTSDTATAYYWSNGATTQSINVSTTGNYSITVANAFGCQNISAPQTVVANPLPPVPVITAAGSTAFCTGDSVVLSADLANSYQWSNGAVSESITVFSSGNYAVTTTNAAGCFNTAAPKTVTVNQMPVAGITGNGPLTFCQGDSVILTANGASNYLWSSGAVTQSIVALSSGNYAVTASNGQQCSASANAGVTAGPPVSFSVLANATHCGIANGSAAVTVSSGTAPYSYHWNTSDSIQNISVLASGTYHVTITDIIHCSASATIVINASDEVALTTTVTGTSCGDNNGSVSVNNLSGITPLSYKWNNGDSTSSIQNLSPQTYSVTATDADGCMAIADVVIGSSDSIHVTITAGNTSICASDSAIICAPPGFASYLWNTGDTGACVYGRLAGNYYLAVTDTDGCTAASNVLALNVHPPSSVSISLNGDTLTVYDAPNYQWYFNNNIIQGADSNVLVASQTGNYSVAVSDSNGCTAFSNQVFVMVTSIAETNYHGAIKIVPNPLAEGAWQLTVDADMIGGTVEVFDNGGRLVFRSEILNEKTEVGSNFGAGIYFVRVFTTATIYTAKLIKL